MRPKEYEFPNGDVLLLEVTNAYAGFHGLTVYTVSYLTPDCGDETDAQFFTCHNGDSYMSEAAALAGFDGRLASDDPFQSFKKDCGGISNLVLEAFKKYLGEGTFRSKPTPDDWDGLARHVIESTFTRRETTYYDGVKILAALEGLGSISTAATAGKADVVLEIPAWKLLEIMTAVTALTMALKQLPTHTTLEKAA